MNLFVYFWSRVRALLTFSRRKKKNYFRNFFKKKMNIFFLLSSLFRYSELIDVDHTTNTHRSILRDRECCGYLGSQGELRPKVSAVFWQNPAWLLVNEHGYPIYAITGRTKINGLPVLWRSLFLDITLCDFLSPHLMLTHNVNGSSIKTKRWLERKENIASRFFTNSMLSQNAAEVFQKALK